MLLSPLLWSEPAGAAAAWLPVAGALLLLAFAVLLPHLGKCFLRAAPLEDERLRRRIEALESRAGRELAGIFVWPGTAGGAFVLGLSRGGRLFLSRELLARLDEEGVACVSAHELGHAALRHPLYALLALLAALLPLAAVHRAAVPLGEAAAAGALAGYLAASFIGAVPFLWRHFELEADLAAAGIVGRETYLALLRRERAAGKLAAGFRHPPAERRIRALEGDRDGAVRARGRRLRAAVTAWFAVSLGAAAAAFI